VIVSVAGGFEDDEELDGDDGAELDDDGGSTIGGLDTGFEKDGPVGSGAVGVDDWPPPPAVEGFCVGRLGVLLMLGGVCGFDGGAELDFGGCGTEGAADVDGWWPGRPFVGSAGSYFATLVTTPSRLITPARSLLGSLKNTMPSRVSSWNFAAGLRTWAVATMVRWDRSITQTWPVV